MESALPPAPLPAAVPQGRRRRDERTPSLRPLDPRLLRYAQSSSRYLVAAVAIGVITTAAIIAQAFALATIVVDVFAEGQSLDQVYPSVWLLAGAIVVRIGMGYLGETTAFKASAQAKRELREQAIVKIAELGPVWMSRQNSAALTTNLTRGIDGLDAYFARYLPQLVLAVLVPIMVGIVIVIQDPLAAVIAAFTLPLIPVFMILVGLYTKSKVERQWRTLSVLSGHFADIFAGMPTLKAFGRAGAQAKITERIGTQYRKSTMGILRISFLSALVLELLAMISIALVAVSIGLRLVNGEMTLFAGLVVLILIPEVYLPLRLVGTNFHAAAEGLGAASQVLDILDTPSKPLSGTTPVVQNLAKCDIDFEAVSYSYPGASELALVDRNFTIPAGKVTALVGPSGCGKSTVLALLERFCDPTSGRIRIGGCSLNQFDPAAWRSEVAWVGQQVSIFPMSLIENVRAANPAATNAEVASALAAVGLMDDLVLDPHELLGETGRRLSVGQTRRLALARAICQRASLILLDEPTAALDAESEYLIGQAITRLRGRATVVMVAHRPVMITLANHVVDLTPVGASA